MNRKQKILLASLIAGHFVILILGVFYRFVDGDEGGYLVVSKEVINGRIPILDINAHNQPLLYYFYGLWMKVFGFNIPAARSLSGIAVFIAGLLIFYWVYKFSKNYWTAASSYLLFIINLTFYKANIPVKPFALSNLFIFSSFFVLTGRYISGRLTEHSTLFFSGLLLGMAMGIRLIFILPVIFIIWLIFVMYKEGIPKFKIVISIAFFSVGVVLPLLPSILIFIKEPFRAYTIWIGAYAQIYLGKGNNPDFMTDILKDMKHDMMLKGLFDVIKTPDTAFLAVLILISTVLLLRKWRQGMDKMEFNIYLLIWMIFGGITYIYSNLYVGYLAYVNQVTLFAILLSIPLLDKIMNNISPKKLIALTGIFLVVTTTMFYLHFQRRLKTSIFYIFHSEEQIITPGFVSDISENVIKKLTKEDDIILDSWGVFVFTSNREPVKGFEYPNDNVIYWKFMLQKEEPWKYLYISESELFIKISRKEIPLIVIGDDRELQRLVYHEDIIKTHSSNSLREHVEKYYDMYTKYFVKPTNAWLLIYLPKKP